MFERFSYHATSQKYETYYATNLNVCDIDTKQSLRKAATSSATFFLGRARATPRDATRRFAKARDCPSRTHNRSPCRLQHHSRSIPGHSPTATFPWGRRQWAQPSRVGNRPGVRAGAQVGSLGRLLVVNIRVILLWEVLGGRYGVSWRSLGRTLRVVSGFLEVSFSTSGLPAGFQPHSTPASASAIGH